MKQIPNTIAVAMGSYKVKAILGGLRTGVIDVLCTDLQTAREVLSLEKDLTERNGDYERHNW
jgi:DNA-binding transcriptional regulator LsrR (DeoR family)